MQVHPGLTLRARARFVNASLSNACPCYGRSKVKKLHSVLQGLISRDESKVAGAWTKLGYKVVEHGLGTGQKSQALAGIEIGETVCGQPRYQPGGVGIDQA